jgi:3-oxoacyl-[acyl-carrier protein] reductase
MVAEMLSAFGQIDVLVNNAGILTDAPLHQMSDETWDEMIAANLRSVFLCARAVLPHMLERGSGKIINVSSLLGQKGMPGRTHYAAAKGGVIAFTRALAREVGPRGIHVNAIAPGLIETELTAGVSEAAREFVINNTPLGYIGSVEDVAAAAVYLASDEARYVTGQVLGVDGGMMMGS